MAYLPRVGEEMVICAKVLYHAGQIGADGNSDLYIVQFENGDCRTLKVADTSLMFGSIAIAS